MVRLKVIQLAQDVVNKANPDLEAIAIAVYLVSGGIDTSASWKYKDQKDARLAQLTEVFGKNFDSSSDWAK